MSELKAVITRHRSGVYVIQLEGRNGIVYPNYRTSAWTLRGARKAARKMLAEHAKRARYAKFREVLTDEL